MPQTGPEISVIIPTHNRAAMLKRAIESVLTQTYQDFEIIVVSDGSTDNTPEVVRDFADFRIRFFEHEKSKGASAARNTGIREARGRYIAFLDDDDEWLSQKLEMQVPVIENSPPEVGLVYGWMEYFQNGKSLSVYKPKLKGDVFVEMLDKQAIGGCPTIIIKREVIDKVGYFDEKLPRGNDGDFIRRVCKYFQVDFVPQIVANIYVGHKDRIGINSKNNLLNEIYAYEYRLTQFEEDFQKYPEIYANLLIKIARSYSLLWDFKSSFYYLKKASFYSGKDNLLLIKLPAWGILNIISVVKKAIKGI